MVRAGHRQHRRRLLRHHPRAHRRHRRDGVGLRAPRDSDGRAPHPPCRHRTDDPGSLMLTDILSAIAAIASAVAAIVAVKIAHRSVELSDKTLTAQETHNRLSVKPIPFVALADYPHMLRVKIANYGSGPL